MQKRILCVVPNVVTYAPALRKNDTEDESYPLCINDKELEEYIDTLTWENNSYYEKLVSVLQAISTIRKGKKRRETTNPESRGAKLRNLEDSIANLDNQQSRAVIETVDGVQRIRGLAGSGKTIVLALKAAYLHAQHPDWKIAVTFNPMSHLTLGQYENCRIPVSSAISPYQFISFVMKNFYRTAQTVSSCELTSFPDKFPLTILPEEKTLVHVCTPV